MHLRDFFSAEAVHLRLGGGSKDEVLAELIGLLRMDERSSGTLLRIIHLRETLASTGIGRGIPIPPSRSLVFSPLRLAFGPREEGISCQPFNVRPLSDFFLIFAPPLEISNQYLPVLGKIAQLAKEPDVPDRLRSLRSPDDFFRLLDEKGV